MKSVSESLTGRRRQQEGFLISTLSEFIHLQLHFLPMYVLYQSQFQKNQTPTCKGLTEVHIMRDYRDVSRIVGAKESWLGPTAGSITTHRGESSAKGRHGI